VRDAQDLALQCDLRPTDGATHTRIDATAKLRLTVPLEETGIDATNRRLETDGAT
jgi:hypothetical protein